MIFLYFHYSPELYQEMKSVLQDLGIAGRGYLAIQEYQGKHYSYQRYKVIRVMATTEISAVQLRLQFGDYAFDPLAGYFHIVPK